MNSDTESRLNISLSPHIHASVSTRRIMLDVVIALIPSLTVAVWVFGLNALMMVGICVATCVLAELAINKFMLHRATSVLDLSAMVTGLLLAFNLPSVLPWWIAVIGCVVAIGIGKMSFGGLGCNIWNPALVGRVFLLISFPAAMTTWPEGIHAAVDAASGASAVDAASGATPLSLVAHGTLHADMFDYKSMLLGNMNGSLGEVGALAIIIGLIYLLIRKVVSWHIPLSIILSAALFSWLFGRDPLFDILAGGLLLGACFMATDYVTSPMTPAGKILFGVMIGFITIIIRQFGAYPEGVSFAILLMNSFVPLINRYFRPTMFGSSTLKKAGV